MKGEVMDSASLVAGFAFGRLAMAWGDPRAMYDLKWTTKSFGSIPVWTTAVNRRGAVLTRPSRRYRSSVSYNAGLQRYLWVQTGLGEDTRFAGALAIYDAPDA
jgi:hypothetical protein